MSNALWRLQTRPSLGVVTFGSVLAAGSIVGCSSDEPPGDPSSASKALRQVVDEGDETASDTTEHFGPLQKAGGTPREAALRYVRAKAQALGIEPPDLSATLPPDREGPRQVPVLWDAALQKYRFTRLSFGQARDGVPVFGARIDVLVRNEADSPVVLVSSGALPLGNFHPASSQAGVDQQKIRDFIRKRVSHGDFRGATRNLTQTDLDTFGVAQPVIWAGSHAAPEKPRLAATLIAHNSAGAERFRLVVDATSGDILHAESQVVFETVSGEVQGKVNPGPSAPECEPIVESPMAHARLFAGGEMVSADQNGAFSFEANGDEPFDLISGVAGTYFTVGGPRGGNERLTETVMAPSTVEFLHNDSEAEGTLAQVNGYVQANQVRDWLLGFHPDFPVIAEQTGFPVNVNLSGGYCPGNAWYDGVSINFCRSSRQYANTSFANVNHHEFGHHIVESAGSGQGEYGEGMGDVISMLLADAPELGIGFFRNDCEEPLRNADNDCQYSRRNCSSCGGEIHSCGQLISGIIWDIRQELAESEGDAALPILSNLVVNSILLHRGAKIDRRIAVHLLTLDDDDADIGNGTPHRTEICAGFQAHGIACPALEVGLKVEPETRFVFAGDPGGPFEPEGILVTLTNRGPGLLTFRVEPSEPWLIVSPATSELKEGEQMQVLVSIDPDVALELSSGLYEASVTFVDESGTAPDFTRPATLQVGSPTQKLSFPLDSDPGWSMDGQWALGPPLGRGGDPRGAASGENVYGYNLSGPYRANLPERTLTTTALDCSDLTETTLRFQRYLGVESNFFDHATIRVSRDGEDWTTVWENGQNDIVDDEWTLQEVDISDVADGSPTVLVQWTMGPTDGSVQYAGWNIDDIEIWGFQN